MSDNHTKHLILGSTNRAKLGAVQSFLDEQHFDWICKGINVPSLVSDQPIGDEETIQGAVNRARGALEEEHADYGMGLEGGLMKIEDTLYLCNWGALVTDEGDLFVGSGARVPLPNDLAIQLEKGEELGVVIDRYANEKNIRHTHGTIGILTDDAVTRSSMFEHVIQLLFGQLSRKSRLRTANNKFK